jgi:predicted thioesterase
MPRREPRLGEEAVREVTVTPEMTARLFEREIHPVYGTAWMVRHVEEAGRMLVEPYLGPEEDATGYSINLKHERSARVGERLTVTARVTHVDDRSCTAEVEVRGAAGVIGRGVFVQRFIRKGLLGKGT